MASLEELEDKVKKLELEKRVRRLEVQKNVTDKIDQSIPVIANGAKKTFHVIKLLAIAAVLCAILAQLIKFFRSY